MSKGQKLIIFNGAVIAFSVLLWIVATFTGWVSSEAFIGHVSMLALVLAGVAGLMGAEATKGQEHE